MWFTDNGRDLLGDETPNDELNNAPKAGLHFGYPYCHQGDTIDPEFGDGQPCSNTHAGAAARTACRGPRSEVLWRLDVPARYRKKLFIVNHGSWNRTAQAGPIGYRIMLATIEGNKVTKYEPFTEGFLGQGRQAWGRPVDLLEMPDGSSSVGRSGGGDLPDHVSQIEQVAAETAGRAEAAILRPLNVESRAYP